MSMASYLVVGEDESVGDNDVFPTGGREDNNLGNVVWSEGLTSAGKRWSALDILRGGCLVCGRVGVDLRIHSICLGLVSVESHNRELLDVCQKQAGELDEWRESRLTVST